MSYSKFFPSSPAARPLPSQSPTPSTYLDFIQNRRKRDAAGEAREPLFPTADERMMRIQDIIWQVADTHVPVLITGESGVGKEVVAQAIHQAGAKKDRPFVAVNCAAMPSTLLESELFGFEKGAFTGADERRIGKFEAASGGTLLLDEVTEIEPALQAKLLRVLQEKEIDRLGGKAPVPIDTRVVATTNRDIMAAVNQGKFRQDLYYRLYVIHLEIPPLRERPKDILLLANHFLSESAASFGREALTLSSAARSKLCEHPWPGNVRELQNVIQRASLLTTGKVIEETHLPIAEEERKATSEWISTLPIGEPLRVVETHFILETLKNHHGNRTHAAKTLGISLRTLRNKINEFTAMGLEVMAPGSGRASS